MSLNELARVMISLSGRSVEPIHDRPRKGDPKANVADTTKAARVLGWRPRTSLEDDGLRVLFQDASSSS